MVFPNGQFEHGCMGVVVLLPAKLAKSPNRELSLLEPATIRRLRGFSRKLSLAILFLLGVPAIVLFRPIGAIALVIDIYYWINIIRIIRKSYSSKVFDVSCPYCEKINRHWSDQNFTCTDCRHLLMRHGDRIYDVTSSGVRALLDPDYANSRYAQIKTRARKI